MDIQRLGDQLRQDRARKIQTDREPIDAIDIFENAVASMIEQNKNAQQGANLLP
jgi:hypothetical protein